ncbi:MAG TPA: hypothetical protein VKT77_18740, partial [Chthonomonadaceae bacterium]|nr:hypothetical protein [Chthonomonadaceae bacterium]
MRRKAARCTRPFSHLVPLAAVPLLCLAPARAPAQAATQPGAPSASAAADGAQIFAPAPVKPGGSAVGIETSEILVGGATLGYRLCHGNVLPETLRLRRAGQLLRVNVDYWLDPASGSLFVSGAGGIDDTLSATYRYVDGPAPAGGPAMPALRLDFGGNGTLGLLYNTFSGNGAGFDTTVYGLSLSGGKLRSGAVQLGGLAYFSNVEASRNLTLGSALDRPAATPPPAPRTGLDHLIAQNLGAGSGKFQLHVDYQDVGRNFAGFQALKAASAADKSTLDTLNALEKQKGLTKLGFDFRLANDAAGKTGLLDVSQLRMTNSATAATAGAPGSAAASLERDSLGLSSGRLALSYTDRKAGAGFSRIDDLTDAEKSGLALDSRLMYDPAAKVDQVTQKDRDQLAREAGIERQDLRGSYSLGAAGKGGALTFSQFRIANLRTAAPGALGSSAIDGLLVGYADKTFQLSYADKVIGSGFTRMADLTDLDRAQLGGARGLELQTLGGALQLDKATNLSFSSIDAAGTREGVASAAAAATAAGGDAAQARKAAESALKRLTATLATTGLAFTAIESHTDRDFARSADLPVADADKKQIELDRGYDSTD